MELMIIRRLSGVFEWETKNKEDEEGKPGEMEVR